MTQVESGKLQLKPKITKPIELIEYATRRTGYSRLRLLYGGRGTEDISQFNRLFRRKFGVTPGQYRGEKEGTAKQLGAVQTPGESHDKRMSK